MQYLIKTPHRDHKLNNFESSVEGFYSNYPLEFHFCRRVGRLPQGFSYDK